MRELAVLTFMTLNGVMQAVRSPEEDSSGGFNDGGWAVDCWDEVMEQVAEEAMAAPYDLLLGRRTYEMFAAAPNSERMTKATKYVATQTLTDLAWENSVAISGDIPTEIARLKSQDGPLLQVHGSWQLIQALLAHDLIDEFRLWVFPVVVGSGKRLFGSELQGRGEPRKLALVKTRSTPNGAVMCIYRREPSA